MATDILQMLADILKISPQVMNQYASASPLEQLFYLLFFPMVFVIVFIYILTSRWMYEHKGLRILIAVAAMAFIVLQGFYNYFVIFSQWWFVGLLVLGVFWFLFGRRPPAGGGAAQGFTSNKKGGGIVNYLESLTGMELNPAQAARLKQELKRQIRYFQEEVKALEDQLKQAKGPEEKNMLQSELANKKAVLAKLTEFQKKGMLKDFARWESSYRRVDIT